MATKTKRKPGENPFIDPLLAAHNALRRAAQVSRRRAKQQYGALAQSYAEAMRIWDRLKAEGVSLPERQAILEQTLRTAWPQVRPWHYECDRCSDTGWAPGICTPETPCGRPFRLPHQRLDDFTGQGRCAPGHEFVHPCVCRIGETRRRHLLQTPGPKDHLANAAKSRKPTRVGR